MVLELNGCVFQTKLVFTVVVEAFMSSLRNRFPETKARPYQFGKLPDLRDATEWGNMVSVMASEGYSDDDISKVMGGNALRVLKRVWK